MNLRRRTLAVLLLAVIILAVFYLLQKTKVERTQKEEKRKRQLYIPLRSISIGDDISYLVTREGRKYAEGSYIGEGFVLRKILPDRLILERDGGTIEYRLEE